MKYTEKELQSFCEKAIKALNKRYHLELAFDCCWWFENNVGSRLHILYIDSKTKKSYEFNQNGNIVTKESELVIDKVADIKKFFPQETKIILRIAYHIFLQLKRDKVI